MIAILLSSSVGLSTEWLTGVSQVPGSRPDVFSCELKILLLSRKRLVKSLRSRVSEKSTFINPLTPTWCSKRQLPPIHSRGHDVAYVKSSTSSRKDRSEGVLYYFAGRHERVKELTPSSWTYELHGQGKKKITKSRQTSTSHCLRKTISKPDTPPLKKCLILHVIFCMKIICLICIYIHSKIITKMICPFFFFFFFFFFFTVTQILWLCFRQCCHCRKLVFGSCLSL